jgi:hypothetical protein
MPEGNGCWVYAVVLDPSRMRNREGILARNPHRDPAKPFLRVGRLPGVSTPSRILRRCPFHGKVSLLEGSAVSYDSDEIRSRLEVGLAMERELVDRLRREGWTVVNPPPDASCSVYVIELDCSVRTHRDVRRTNPHGDPLRACLYVGQTRRTPEERYAEHQEGTGLKKGGRHLRGVCLRLRPDLYGVFNPMPLLESLVMERELAQELREQGFTVLGGH